MSRVAVFFLLVIASILAMLLALLGVKTIPANPLGWFLLLVGVAAPPVWSLSIPSVTLGMGAAFYLSPVEYLF